RSRRDRARRRGRAPGDRGRRPLKLVSTRARPSRLCNRGALPLARATGQGAGVREGWGARRRPPQEGKWAGLRGAGGAGAPGRAARRARARGVVASPKAEAAAGARRWRACEARAVVLPALLFPLLSGWRRPRRCWARSPFLSLRRPLPALSRCAVSPTQDCPGPDMARGQQKIQSQQKNAKKQAGQKKKQGHDQKAAAKAALIYTCTVCRKSKLTHGN
uniref:Small EDRK-rich factor-like N-terminal domain-containing protein n=6 Tax=Catarrhini TaxID=9526 RepID=A0A8I5N4W8_PAPAN